MGCWLCVGQGGRGVAGLAVHKGTVVPCKGAGHGSMHGGCSSGGGCMQAVQRQQRTYAQ